jgi:hypothetical protein
MGACYGGVVVIDFARRSWRVAINADYEHVMPVRVLDDLQALARITSGEG